MSDFIAIDPAEKRLLNDILKKAPQFVRDMVVDEVADYEVKVFQEYPSQKRVSRKEAYGQTFKSDKQRRYVMGVLIPQGKIPYRRTQTLRKGWKKIGSGESVIVANEVPYGPLVMGAGTQARMMEIIGWKPPEQIMEERGARIDRIAQAAAEKGLKKAGAR